MIGEEMATVTAAGDVGISRLDLAAAASSPLQPPSAGQDWEVERDQPSRV